MDRPVLLMLRSEGSAETSQKADTDKIKSAAIVAIALSVPIVATRCMTRVRSTDKFMGDDWSSVASVAFLVAVASIPLASSESLPEYFSSLGNSKIPDVTLAKLLLAWQILFDVGTVISKISILLLLKRMISSLLVQLFIKTFIVFLASHALAFAMIILFQCSPIQVAEATLNTVENLVLLLLPVQVLRHTKLINQQKIGLVAIYVLAITLFTLGIIRIQHISLLILRGREAGIQVNLMVVEIIELLLAVLLGSFPPLCSLFYRRLSSLAPYYPRLPARPRDNKSVYYIPGSGEFFRRIPSADSSPLILQGQLVGSPFQSPTNHLEDQFSSSKRYGHVGIEANQITGPTDLTRNPMVLPSTIQRGVTSNIKVDENKTRQDSPTIPVKLSNEDLATWGESRSPAKLRKYRDSVHLTKKLSRDNINRPSIPQRSYSYESRGRRNARGTLGQSTIQRSSTLPLPTISTVARPKPVSTITEDSVSEYDSKSWNRREDRTEKTAPYAQINLSPRMWGLSSPWGPRSHFKEGTFSTHGDSAGEAIELKKQTEPKTLKTSRRSSVVSNLEYDTNHWNDREW